MEDLATAPPPRHRARRHRRKASDSATYGDVFGGGPRFAPPLAGAPADYADVFGGVAASCSIPYLDLPPAAAGSDGGAGRDGEIFTRAGFGEYAAPYEDMFAEPEGMPEEIESWSGSSRTNKYAKLAFNVRLSWLEFAWAVHLKVFTDLKAKGFKINVKPLLVDLTLFIINHFCCKINSSTVTEIRSSIRKESAEMDAEPSLLYQHYPNVVYDQQFDEEQFSPISFPPDGEQQFNMSYNKATRGRLDDLVEMTTCMVEPSISYVVDSCNLSNDSATNHVPVMDNGALANGEDKEMSPPPLPASGDSVADEKQHISPCLPIYENHYEDKKDDRRSSIHSASSEENNGATANDENKETSPPQLPVNGNPVTDEKQHISTCLLNSENLYEDEKDHKRSSAHSASSEEVPSPDYPFLRMSNTHIQTQPINVQPPSILPSNFLNKKESKSNRDSEGNPNSAAADAIKEATDVKQNISTCLLNSENLYEDEKDHKRSSTHSASSEEVPSPDYPFLRVSNTHIQTPPIKVQPPSILPSNFLNNKESKSDRDSEVNPNSAAAAAIKEAMNFAEARLKAAKELMERKGDSFKLRKRPGHHRGTKSTEIKEDKSPEEVNIFEEKLTSRKLAEEENYENLSFLDKHRGSSAVKIADCYQDGKGVLSPGKPQQIIQSDSKVDQLGKWASDAEFYDLVSHHRKSTTSTAACEGDNGLTTNPFTKHGHSEKVKEGVNAGDLERDGKLSGCNEITELGTIHVNLTADDAAALGVEHEAPTAPEGSLWEERVEYQETNDSHIKEHVGQSNSPKGHDDDGIFEASCMNGIPPKLHVVPDTSSLSLKVCIPVGHANGNQNCSDASTEETPPVGKYDKENNNKEGLEIPCADETLCTSVRNQISDEHLEIPIIDEIETSQAKVATLEEPAEYYEDQWSPKMSNTVHREAKTYEEDKMFSFVDEACLQSEQEKITELPSETLIHKEMERFGIEEKESLHEDSQDEDVYWDAGSPEKETSVTSDTDANENDEAEVLNVFVADSDLMENNVRTCATSAKHSDQLPESQESLLEPQELANNMDVIEDFVSHGNGKEAKNTLLGNSETALVEKTLNHDTEGQTSTETGATRGLNDVYAEIIAKNNRAGNVLHSGAEVITDDYSDYTTCSKDMHASFSEACTSMHHLPQNVESISALTSDESISFLVNLEENCIKADSGYSTIRDTALQGKKAGGKIEEGDGKDKISSVNLKDQQSFGEDSASKFVQKSRKETSDAQRIEGRDDIRKAEGEIEKDVSLRPDKDKEREYKLEKEQSKEKPIRELEEEKERERERAKDRLAVQRATREAHERAFAEARTKAERIALERITSSRQRASAEARVKEKASDEAVAEKASREARMKVERAAVERATAEARERAIEKAKAAADAKERIEKARVPFKDSFKATNQYVM
uniref:Auxilin-like protein 1 n=1 Tax=Aegilops tauschii TaxID=37682 RepID=M8BVD9_AEGTA